MNFLIWLLLAVGGFLVYSGFRGKNPLTILKATLTGGKY